MIDKTIKNIKKYFKTLKKILTAKISKKKKKNFTRYIKGQDIQNGSNIS